MVGLLLKCTEAIFYTSCIIVGVIVINKITSTSGLYLLTLKCYFYPSPYFIDGNQVICENITHVLGASQDKRRNYYMY